MTAAGATQKGKQGDPFSSPWRRRLPLLPALIFLVLVTQLPFVVSIYYSLTNLKDKTQLLIPQPTRFVGLDNYRTLLSNQFFRDAMWTSVEDDGSRRLCSRSSSAPRSRSCSIASSSARASCARC